MIVRKCLFALVATFVLFSVTAAWAETADYPPAALMGWAEMKAANNQMGLTSGDQAKDLAANLEYLKNWRKGRKHFYQAAGIKDSANRELTSYYWRAVMAAARSKAELLVLQSAEPKAGLSENASFADLQARRSYLQGQLLRRYIGQNREIKSAPGDRVLVEMLLLTNACTYLTNAAGAVNLALEAGYSPAGLRHFWEMLSKADLLLTGVRQGQKNAYAFSLQAFYGQLGEAKRIIIQKGDQIITALSKGQPADPGMVSLFRQTAAKVWPTYLDILVILMDKPPRPVGQDMAAAKVPEGLYELVRISADADRIFPMLIQGRLATIGPALITKIQDQLVKFGELARVGHQDRARLTNYHAKAGQALKALIKGLESSSSPAELTSIISSLTYSTNRMFRFLAQETAGDKAIHPTVAAVMISTEAVQSLQSAMLTLSMAAERQTTSGYGAAFWSALARADVTLMALKRVLPKKSWSLFLQIRGDKSQLAEKGDELLAAINAGDTKEQQNLLKELARIQGPLTVNYRNLCESAIKRGLLLGIQWGFFPAF